MTEDVYQRCNYNRRASARATRGSYGPYVSFRMDGDEHDALYALAERHGCTVSEVMRLAISLMLVEGRLLKAAAIRRAAADEKIAKLLW